MPKLNVTIINMFQIACLGDQSHHGIQWKRSGWRGGVRTGEMIVGNRIQIQMQLQMQVQIQIQ